MKSLKRIATFATMTALAVLTMNSCKEEENPPASTGVTQVESKTYKLSTVDVDGIFGEAKFIKNSDNTVTIELALEGTPDGGVHPAHIHFNTALEGGGIALTLGAVDGTTGKSSVTFDTLNDGSTITYEELLDFDGYINVHLSSTMLGTVVAQGDIGENELTTDMVSYTLATKDVDGISGSVKFEKRKNGEALATISLVGTPDGGSHPAHIHVGDVTTPGGIAFTFTPVDGTTGMSRTNISALNNTTAFGYDDVLTYDGYVNVHLSSTMLGTIVAQGNIGSNVD